LAEQYAIKADDAEILTTSIVLADFFESVAQTTAADAKIAANWVIGELSAALNRDGRDLEASQVSAGALAGLLDRIHDNTISGKIAKEVFEAMWAGQGTADEIIKSKGLRQITDSSAIDEIVDAVIAANPGQAEEYRAGKDKLLGFFVGQVMKETRGQANPGQVNEAIKRQLGAK
jgi:aspartyl-tRNA(Asn)/glutamyl-tRNA(Gln) amidotransferase subunit B